MEGDRYHALGIKISDLEDTNVSQVSLRLHISQLFAELLALAIGEGASDIFALPLFLQRGESANIRRMEACRHQRRAEGVTEVKMRPVEKRANEVKLQEGRVVRKRGSYCHWISLCSLLKLA